MKKDFWFIILLFSVVLFTACNHIQTGSQKHSETDSQNNYLVSIRLYQQPESLFSRSAIPSYSENDFTHPENLQWQFTFTENNSSQTISFNSQELQKNESGFLIPVPQGSWNISATNTFFEGSLSNIEISDTGFYNIELPVFFITDGTGTASLKINTEDSEITKVFVEIIAGTQSNNIAASIMEDFYFADDSNIITIYRENIPSGTYNTILQFYHNDLCVLSLPETINIRKNCITNKWIEEVYSTSEINIINLETNDLHISKELIRTIRGNVFYTNNAVQQIIDLINYLNDEQTTYTVLIDGIITPETVSTSNIYINTFEIPETFISISSEKPLHLLLQAYSSGSAIDACGNENHKCHAMEITGNVHLEIKDLIITGCYTEQNGAGIYISTPIETQPNLILSGTTKITGNYTTNSGGGLYIDEGAVLIKDNVEISSNTALTKGGGICILGKSGKDKRTLEIQGGTISTNTALSKNKNTGVGGGLYTQFGIIHINNCLLSQNQAANGGGIGIAQNSNIYITNTLITENTAVYGASASKGGGGIFASGVSANLHLQEGCYITNNYTNSESSKGGGISITTTNVHISSNVCITQNYYLSSSSAQNLQSNVSLASGKTLTIDDSLENVQIGITTADSPTETNPIIFTHNYSRYNTSSNPADFFFADNPTFSISIDEQGEAIMITP